MKFEHLIQINDPLFPLLPPLTREEIWNGLIQRAHDPVPFILGLNGCTITEKSHAENQVVLSRILDYGTFQVHDRVTFDGQRVVTDVQGSSTWPTSRLTITIEEPNQYELFMRFIYEWDEAKSSESELDETTRAIRVQAYISSDIDTVQKIREIAALKKCH